MSYDLEILAKIESGDYISIDEPENSSPTYNLGKCLGQLWIGISTKVPFTMSLIFLKTFNVVSQNWNSILKSMCNMNLKTNGGLSAVR